MDVLKHNISQILISLDQFLNTFICSIIDYEHKQWADETFSAHCYRCRDRSMMWKILYNSVNFLFKWQNENHCFASYQSEINRKHLPKEYE